jgi:PA-IL-like protein
MLWDVTVCVDARHRWNHTGIFADAGKRYCFTVSPDAKWFDWKITSGPEGYTRWFLLPFRLFLRVRRGLNGPARFFSLIATIGESTEYAFVIGYRYTMEAPISGEIVCFANDAPWAYGNNSGSLEVAITPEIDVNQVRSVGTY